MDLFARIFVIVSTIAVLPIAALLELRDWWRYRGH